MVNCVYRYMLTCILILDHFQPFNNIKTIFEGCRFIKLQLSTRESWKNWPTNQWRTQDKFEGVASLHSKKSCAMLLCKSPLKYWKYINVKVPALKIPKQQIYITLKVLALKIPQRMKITWTWTSQYIIYFLRSIITVVTTHSDP